MGCDQSEILNFVNDQQSGHGGQRNNSRPIQQIQPQAFEEHHGSSMPNRPQEAKTSFPPQHGQLKKNASEKMGMIKHHIAPREHLDPHVSNEDDFLAHHLRYELTMTKLTSMKRIRRRQIFEHLYLQCLWGNFGGVPQLEVQFQVYQESLLSSWTQRTFLDIWQIAHNDLFVKGLSAKVVRRKVAEQFMFELYEINEYVDAGMASINFLIEQTRSSLNSFVQASDDALFNVFKKLKEKYPQTSNKQEIDFPDVPTTKTSANILDNFSNLSFSDPDHMNYKTIYQDISFLLKKAVDEQDQFKEDMKDILGDDVLACNKVAHSVENGRTTFNACAVRRVFVKWCQNMLEKCPELQYTKTFMNFIKARGKIVENFFFKSTIQPTTHKIVLDCISLLVELAKYGLQDKKKRAEFIFNIYDLLRCKVKRSTPQKIVELLQKMKSTKTTKSGKKFEVLRVKNRFRTNNRDLLINFKYGDVLVGQAQLCIDSTVSKEAKLNYEFCHYIYELERSLFGPTIELMMSYQDFQRPDITVDFEAQDLVIARRDEKIEHGGPVDRKCVHGHDMISLKGNFFFPGSPGQSQDEIIANQMPATCNFCDRKSTTQDPYDYCYHCGCFLCKKCTERYKKTNIKDCWLSIQREDLLPEIKNLGELSSLCAKNKSMAVLFWLQNSSASQMYRDGMIFHQSKLLMQPDKYIPFIGAVKYSEENDFKQLAKKYKVNMYPTLILFDANAKPVRTIVGFSWFETAHIYATQHKLVQGKGISDFDITCLGCQEVMKAEMGEAQGQEQEQEEDQDFEEQDHYVAKIPEDFTGVCLGCFGVSKALNVPKIYSNVIAKCSSGHVRCLNCSYAAFQFPSTYKDFTGGNYLTSTFVRPKLEKCPKGHQTVIRREDPNSKWQFTCFKCKKQRFFDNEHGVGECTKCDQFMCAQCLGADRPTFNQLKKNHSSDLVKHYVESTAEQACKCVCQRHFKKAYCGRILSLADMGDYKETNWRCFLCNGVGKDGELHLACFACPKMSEDGTKFNFQICFNCATKSKMMMREPPAKILELPSLFSCPKDGNQMVHTTFAYKNKLIINCHYCNRKYFGNTERFACLKCDLNCCKNCREHLWKGKPPQCLQTCPQNHKLIFEFVKPNTLEYCDGCMTVMRDEAFKCYQDDYVLCANCVKTNPPHFKGTILQHIRGETDQNFGCNEMEGEEAIDIDAAFSDYSDVQGDSMFDEFDDW